MPRPYSRILRVPCPCCGYRTFRDPEYGSYDLCPVCFWEDDDLQLSEPDYRGGANEVSLREARSNFRRFGACDEASTDAVRSPRLYERPRRLLPLTQR